MFSYFLYSFYTKKARKRICFRAFLAEIEGFEPSRPLTQP